MITKLVRAVFLTSNFCLLMLSIGVALVGIVNLGSTATWMFGNVGSMLLLTYACFQVLMVVLGPFTIGVFKASGTQRPLFALWLVLGLIFLLMNFYTMQFGLHGEISAPGALCGDTSSAWCHRDVVDVVEIFWSECREGCREDALTELPADTTCSLDLDVPMTDDCAYDVYDLFNSYVLFMGITHFVILVILVPSGLASYVQWMRWRDRSKHMFALDADKTDPIEMEDSGANLVENEVDEIKDDDDDSDDNDKKPAPANQNYDRLTAVFGRRTSNIARRASNVANVNITDLQQYGKKQRAKSIAIIKERTKALGVYGVLQAAHSLSMEHKLLSVYFKTKQEFPRSDRVLCVMAYILGELWVVGLFRNSGVVAAGSTAHMISHAILCIICSSVPVAIMVMMFNKGYAFALKADKVCPPLPPLSLPLSLPPPPLPSPIID
jgi:hypothetical protein